MLVRGGWGRRGRAARCVLTRDKSRGPSARKGRGPQDDNKGRDVGREVPTLRKKREGWGTLSWDGADGFKYLTVGHPPSESKRSAAGRRPIQRWRERVGSLSRERFPV